MSTTPPTHEHDQPSPSDPNKPDTAGPLLSANTQCLLRSWGDQSEEFSKFCQLAEERVEEILRLWITLRDVLDRHQDTICRTWGKKKVDKRLKTIMRSWHCDTLPDTRRLKFFKSKVPPDDKSLSLRYHYLMPYINKEDLCKPHILPLLLRSRAYNLPSQFAGADATTQAVACKFGGVEPEFHPSVTMRLHGFTEDTIGKYGELASWNDGEALNEFINRKQFDTGEGMLVLEVQLALFRFLVNCCMDILRGPLGDPKLENWITNYPVVVPTLSSRDDSPPSNSLAVITEEAPFRVPAKFDIQSIESLITARASQAEDKLWQMREDPVYFSELIKEAKMHRPEIDLEDPARRMMKKDRFWNGVLQDVLGKTYYEIRIFKMLKQLAHDAAQLRFKYAEVISPKDDLPEDYMNALIKLRFFLNMVVTMILINLQTTIISPVPFTERSLKMHRSLSDPSKEVGNLIKKAKIRSKTEERLAISLDMLMRPHHDGMTVMRIVGMALGVYGLAQLLKLGKDDPVSPYVEAYMGDLSILIRCIEQLDMYHPWARSFKDKSEALGVDFHAPAAGERYYPENDKPEFYRQSLLHISWHASTREGATPPPCQEPHEGPSELRKEWQQMTTSWLDTTILLAKSIRVDKHVPLFIPFTKSVRYPIDRAPTRDNIEALRLAESNLDAFWESIDDILISEGGSSVQCLSRVLRRTQEWVAPEVKENAPGEKDLVHQEPDTHYPPYISKFCNKDDGIPRTTPKMKTRGASATLPDEANVSLVATPVQVPQLVEVDKNSLKVFRNLFFTPNVSATPGEIPWTDFVRSMTVVGFRATELYGSVWQFQPVDFEANRSILFHEPHPKGKVPYFVARHIGRRLTKAYGWESGSFALKAKR